MTQQEKQRVGPPLWVSLLVYAVLSVLLTWPLAQHLGTHFPSPNTDVFNVYWGNWWVRTALASGQNPYVTDYLIYPVGFNLATFAFSPFLASLWIPLSWIVSPIAAYNLVVLATIVLCCVAMDQLVRYLTGNGWAALVAGISFGFSPILAGQRASHLNLSMVAWIPWAALFLTRLMRQAQSRDAALLAVTIGLAFLTRLHVGLLVLMFLATYFLGLLLAERSRWHRKAFARLALAGLLTLVLVGPLVIYVVQALNQPGGESLIRWQAEINQVDLLAYVLPTLQHPLFGPLTRPVYEQRFENNTQYWAFVGLVPLLLALFVAVTRPRKALPWLLTGFFFFVLALGPMLRLNGSVYPQVTVPYGWATALFSTFGFDIPNRFNLAMMPALCALIGLACAEISRRTGRSWPVLLVGLFIVGEYLIVPLPVEPAPADSAFYDQLAADDKEYAIVDFPLQRAPGEIHRYWQTRHTKPIVGGWDHRVPSTAFDFIESNPLLSTWSGRHQDDVTLDQALLALADANVRYAVFHKEQTHSVAERMQSLLLTVEPVFADDSVHVLPLDASFQQDYDIVRRFGQELALARPAAFLSTVAGSHVPQLTLSTCWVLGSPGAAEATAVVTVTDSSGNVALEKAAALPARSEGLACQHWPLELEGRTGSYDLAITAVSGEEHLGTYTTTLPIQALEHRRGEAFPAVGHEYSATYDAPLELLGFNLVGDEGFVWVDLYWRATAPLDQPLILTMHLLDPVTGQPVVSAGDILHRLEWKRGDLLHETRVLWLDDVPQGQYPLGLVLSPQAEPEQSIRAYDSSLGDPWPDDMAVLNQPLLVLPAALGDLPVSSEDRIVAYTTAEAVAAEPEHRVNAVFEGIGELVGYTLVPDQLIAGEDLDVSLYWLVTSQGPVERDYTVFVHLVDASGQMLAQHDGEPVMRLRPTHTWRAGDLVVDSHQLDWGRADYAGPATLFVGMYDAESAQRLPMYGVDGERLPDDAMRLSEIQIRPPE
ncbi:hypothetical protein ACFLWA_06455 [Chloroflexota bacterium]